MCVCWNVCILKYTTPFAVLYECMLVCVTYDFSQFVCVCLRLSVSLKCLTVLSCPQSVTSRKVETSKKKQKKKKNTSGRRDEGEIESYKQKQDVHFWTSCSRYSVFLVFISYAYWCCVIVCLAAMKPGRGQQTSLWGAVKDSVLTAPT